MALHQPSLTDTTRNIDLVVVDETALSRLMSVLDELGYKRVTDLGDKSHRWGPGPLGNGGKILLGEILDFILISVGE